MDVHSEDLPGNRSGLVQRICGLDSAGLAASAHEDLRLDHAGERRVDHVVRSRSGDSVRDWDAIPGEDLLRLVLEELHAGPEPPMGGRPISFVIAPQSLSAYPSPSPGPGTASSSSS